LDGDGCKLSGNRLYVQGVGTIKVKLHRPVAGLIETVTLKMCVAPLCLARPVSAHGQDYMARILPALRVYRPRA